MKALESDLSAHMRSSNLERGLLISPVTGLSAERAGIYLTSVLICLFTVQVTEHIQYTRGTPQVKFEGILLHSLHI